MSSLDLVRVLLGERLPIRHGRRELGLEYNDPSRDVDKDDYGIFANLRLSTYDADKVVGEFPQIVPLLYPDFARSSPERVSAFLEGWLLALPTLLDRAPDPDPDPRTVVCPPAQRDPRATTATEYRDLMLQPDGPMHEWKCQLTGEDWESALSADLRDQVREHIRERVTDGDDVFDIVLSVQSVFAEHNVDARLITAAKAITEEEIAAHEAARPSGP